MDLNLSDEQRQLVDSFSSFYDKECGTERVRSAEPSGHDAELWARLLEMGALEMAVDEASGGWGASLLDLALVAEQHGRHLGPAPLVEAQVAARLLSRAGSPEAGRALEGAIAGGRLTTIALHPPVGGTLKMVPSGAVADAVIFYDGDRLRCAETSGRSEAISNLGSMPVADVGVDESAVELVRGEAARALFERARDEWLVLMANALVGLGERALEIGVDYAKERHAFGVPIGSFQAVSHGLANAATALDGGMLLAREAAWAAAEDRARFTQLACFACAFCTEAAREASYRGLHYHGGYGFMLEFDIQLFYRRATAWPGVFGEPASVYARGEADRLAVANGRKGA